MIVLTAEMRAAACRRMGVDELDPQTEGALVDVLTLVERDHDVTPKLPPVEHRTVERPWWNHTMGEFNVRCSCGETFSSGDLKGAKWRLEDHIDDRAGGS